ncbi:AraC family transcriptional regulator [Occultella gossypii]|uniref:Helix-turn-helix transcriptional regulator n=1 Tax=Occultella gossypii TaxID=2800820 RepID=A0ABS7SGP3_9MICO|nr:AraC family transcriptional regulator [Occultella gossypii]MBZ2199531.1 helix-turn-helix transcriptional regulator [Occultella gossypii]
MAADFVTHVQIRERFATLRQVGIAAESYPKYVKTAIEPHHLDVVLMTFVRAGRGQHVMGEAVHEILAPSVAVTMAGEPHSVVSDADGVDVVNVFIDPLVRPLPTLSPPLDLALAALIPLPSAPALSPTRFAQVELRDDDRFAPLLDLLVAETAQPRNVELIEALRTALLATCAHAVVERGLLPGDPPRNATDARIGAVRAWLDQHYLEQHSLGSLAERAHLERTYFSTRFSQVVGMSFSEYVIRLRIRYAAGLLQTTERTVSEISRASGFRDLSNFGRAFKRLTGVAPRQFRREARAVSGAGGDQR